MNRFVSFALFVALWGCSEEKTLHHSIEITPKRLSAEATEDGFSFHADNRLTFGFVRHLCEQEKPEVLSRSEVEFSLEHTSGREMFEVSPSGIKHTITVRENKCNSDLLRMEIETNGEVTSAPGGVYVNVDNGKWFYGGLKIWDASGSILEGRILGDGNNVRIEVEDEGALYPITIDPFALRFFDKLVGDPNDFDFDFVEVSNERVFLVHGGFFSNFAGLDFWQKGVNGWTYGGQIGPNRSENIWEYPEDCLSADGDRVVTSNVIARNSVDESVGALFVFERDLGGPDNWGQAKKIEGGPNDARLGYACAIDGEEMVGTTVDRVFVYGKNVGGPDNWGELAELSDAPATYTFSSPTVKIENGVIALDGSGVQKTVVLYGRDVGGSNNYGQLKELSQPGNNYEEYGESLDLEGDRLVVGVPEFREPNRSPEGAVLIYERNLGGPDNWGLAQEIRQSAANKELFAKFGAAVALDGDRMIVGAPEWNAGGGMQGGAVFSFEYDILLGQWVETDLTQAFDTRADFEFGKDVDLDGGDVIIAAHGSNNGQTVGGGGYVFGVNQPPVADPQIVSTDEDVPLAITLTGSDPDPADTLTFTVIQPPALGTLSGTAPNVTFTPVANYTGVVTLDFEVSDGLSEDTARVIINVDPVNDPPIANGQTIQVNEDVPQSVILTGSDVELGPLTFAVVDSPQNGVLIGMPPNLSYEPSPDFFGADSFTFVADDGDLISQLATVSLDVLPIDDPPQFIPPTPTGRVVGDDVTLMEFTVAGSDIDTPTLTYDASPLPAGSSLDEATGEFSWQPSYVHEGDTAIEISVSDLTTTVVRTITLEVNLVDSDNDGLPDSFETENGLNPDSDDSDSDGIDDGVEVGDFREGAIDTDNDQIIDALDTDSDDDGLSDQSEGTEDPDDDGVPNFRDDDSDGDGVFDRTDNCPFDPNPDQRDTDQNGEGDVCTDDDDGDGVTDQVDNCPLVVNPDQIDSNDDGVGDACTGDADGDGVPDGEDNCINVANTDQADTDNDGVGNACSDDDDGDGVKDSDDPCPLIVGTECDPSVDPDPSVPTVAEGGCCRTSGVPMRRSAHVLLFFLVLFIRRHRYAKRS